MVQQINYSPLENNRLSSLRKTYFKRHAAAIPLVVVNVLLLIVLIAYWCIIRPDENDTASAVLALLTAGYFFVILVPYLLWAQYYDDSYKNKMWREFADINQWVIDQENDGKSLLPPGLNFGYDKTYGPVVLGRLVGLDVRLFTYVCSISKDKALSCTVAQIDLPREMPHILLANKNSTIGTKEKIDNDIELQLEGNFSQYFKLYMQKGQQIDVLTILTPDVMQTMVEHNFKQDIEIYKDKLYIIASGTEIDDQSVKNLISSVEVLALDVLQNLNYPQKQL